MCVIPHSPNFYAFIFYNYFLDTVSKIRILMGLMEMHKFQIRELAG